MRKLALLIFSLLAVTGKIKSQNIYTVVGNGINANTGDGGLALAASITGGYIAIDRENNLYLASTYPFVIRKIDLNTGIITHYAGTGVSGFSGDGGSAINAQITAAYGLATNNAGDLFLFDGGNNRIRKIDKQTGIITTIAGNGTDGTGGDGGHALLAQLTNTGRIAIDSAGNIYTCEWSNPRIRKIDATTNIITTIAGTGISGHSGDGGPALQADISGMYALCVDKHGNVYISGVDDRIRKIDITTGLINTVAGNGPWLTCTGSGLPATTAKLNTTYSIYVDKEDNLYTTESQCHIVRKVDASTQIISTLAGTGAQGYGGDGGQAINAILKWPEGIAADTCGNIYFVDDHNYRVRRIDMAPTCLPVSTDDIKNDPLSFTLSPNPATSQITITSSTKLKSIIVTNTIGALVKSVVCGNEKEVVDIGELSSGVYFVKVVDVNGGVRVEKMVKE